MYRKSNFNALNDGNGVFNPKMICEFWFWVSFLSSSLRGLGLFSSVVIGFAGTIHGAILVICPFWHECFLAYRASSGTEGFSMGFQITFTRTVFSIFATRKKHMPALGTFLVINLFHVIHHN